MGYLIKKNNKTNEIVFIDYNFDGYVFHPRRTNEKTISVNSITIINPTLIDKILTIKFNQLYKKIALRAIDILNDDEDPRTTGIVLDEFSKLKAIVKHKYQKFLSDEKEKEFLEKIRYLENALKTKAVIYNYFEAKTMESMARKR